MTSRATQLTSWHLEKSERHKKDSYIYTKQNKKPSQFNFSHSSSHTSQYLSTGASFSNIHMTRQTHIIDTFLDKWQDRSGQKTPSPHLHPSTAAEAQSRANKLLSPDVLQIYLSCSISMKILPCKMFPGILQNTNFRNLSRYIKIPPSLAAKKKYTWFYLRQTQFNLRKNTAQGLHLCHVFNKAAEIIHNWILLSGGKRSIQTINKQNQITQKYTCLAASTRNTTANNT